jgi:hypothetical protein
MTTYTARGNCIRAARAALGKDAKPGTDFTIGGEAGAFTWTSTGTRAMLDKPARQSKPKKAKAAKKAKAKKGKSTVVLSTQPQMKKLIGLCQRKDGATIEEMCERLTSTSKPLHTPTVRGAISRLNAEGNVTITTTRKGRIKHYHCAA